VGSEPKGMEFQIPKDHNSSKKVPEDHYLMQVKKSL